MSAAVIGRLLAKNDLLVDQHDLELWQIGFGTTTEAAHLDGDSNSDRDADGSDFLAWQQQRPVAILLAAPNAVPEPTLAGLAVGFLVAAGNYRARLDSRVR